MISAVYGGDYDGKTKWKYGGDIRCEYEVVIMWRYGISGVI